MPAAREVGGEINLLLLVAMIQLRQGDQRQLLLPVGDNYFCRWVGRADGLCDGAELRAPAGCRGSWSPGWSATGRSAC
jgi:hypothetical protein